MGMKNEEVIVFGGGCFWCTEAVFKMLKGVSSVMPGYAGGTIENPTYEEVSSGTTGHAEAVQIIYNPGVVRLRDLLTVFFASHDPTTMNRQGNDVGTQYRSVIFITNEDQKREVEDFIKELNNSSVEGKLIVTELKQLERFHDAETYHQDYYKKNSQAAYCELVINPKLEKVQKQFAGLLNEQEWKKNLMPEQYKVLREKGTEAPFTGKLLHVNGDGVYVCAACGNSLFSSAAKFDSGTGWPSFDEALPGAVTFEKDQALGMKRTEVKCARCGSHLGHVFDDGPTKTGKRYCLNSVCLDLKNDAEKP